MFGHQDEPQQLANDTTDSSLDAGLTDIINTTTPVAPSPSPASGAPSPGLLDATPPASAAGYMAAISGSSLATPTPPLPPATLTDQASRADTVDTNTLLDIKQQALQQLSPLVSHLDQNPEERFRTTMMMIQASDNQDLISTAYTAAQAITDEKSRAQALLDLVNEINYFTQHQTK